jgi:hypothetical protein
LVAVNRSLKAFAFQAAKPAASLRFHQPGVPGYRVTSAKRLAFSDAEEFRAADRANALGGGSLVLQGYRLRVFDFPLGPAFHAISLHLCTSFGTLSMQVNKIVAVCQ